MELLYAIAMLVGILERLHRIYIRQKNFNRPKLN